MSEPTLQPDQAVRDIDPNKLLYSLMIPAIIMPLSGWMLSVSLPTIRDQFGLDADVAAWIATGFTLPFMIMMPVYGRISDGLGKRRLLLLGITIFALGSLVAASAGALPMLLFGRVLMGLGAAALLPLSLALVTEVFRPNERGEAMGKWSTVGPATGVIGPILAGFIVGLFGWRSAFVPPFIISVIGLAVVYWLIPSSIRTIRFDFLRTFDWTGVLLLSGTLTSLLFYLSSRPITGVTPLQDWRLALLFVAFLVVFIWHARRRENPFIRLDILKNNTLVMGSILACLRMLCLSGGFGFLMPLYLADVFQLDPTRSGFYLMLNPLAMFFVVRLAGRFSDRWGSRYIVMTGFSLIGLVLFSFTVLNSNSPHWQLLLMIFVFGVGAGLMLASLHRAALNDVPESDMGTSSGVYSMIRFIGSAAGSAVGGILLQYYLNRSGTNVSIAYQSVYLWFVGISLLGLLTAIRLPKNQ